MCAYVARLLRAAGHSAAALFILILPFGYESPDSDSTDFKLGLYGGTGQVAAVIRDCSGAPVASETARFNEAGGSASLHLGSDKTVSFWVTGRAGTYRIDDARTPVPDWYDVTTPSPEQSFTEEYAGVSLSVEGPAVGIGFGFIAGDLPIYYSYFAEPTEGQSHLKGSGHFRLGYINRFHLLASLAEGRPLLSSGPLQIGFGYPFSNRVHGFSGLSTLWYDRAGFLQTVSIDLNRHLAIDFSGRFGSAAGHTEASISAGLTYGFGFPHHSR